MEKRATNIRRLVLGVALVATLLAVVWLEENDVGMEETVQPIVPARAAPNKASSTLDKKSDMAFLTVDQLGQRKFNPEADDIFAPTSWQPKRSPAGSAQSPFGLGQAAKPVPPPIVAPPPTAPPLPYKYVGKITEGEITRIFLSKAEDNYIAEVGKRLEADYRVDRINDDAIELTYLPLGIKQTLLINNNNPGKF